MRRVRKCMMQVLVCMSVQNWNRIVPTHRITWLATEFMAELGQK